MKTTFTKRLGPWPNVAAARSFLAFLAGYQPESTILTTEMVDENRLAPWLAAQGLSLLAYARCREAYPSLAALLETARYSYVAQNSLHQNNLARISSAFNRSSTSLVLLKGAAIAEAIADGWDIRTMADVDIWLQGDDFAHAGQIMAGLGFESGEKESRPQALQMMSGGEIQFAKQDWHQDLVEFHLSPFKGWWLTRTAAVDKQAIWSRVEPLDASRSLYQLSVEDTIIHLAVHLAVNHQCGLMPLRSLLDIALIDSNRPVDWQIIVERAQEMRVSTAVWLVLSLLQQLVGTPGVEKPVGQLKPSRWRQRTLQKVVSPESILLGQDISSGRLRFLYLLLLVDRSRDMGRLVLRTLWPEKEWLLARYGEPVTHGQHLAHLIRHGQV